MDTPDDLQPLPYHVQLVDYLRTQECDLWEWFASARAQSEHFEADRLRLLRTTYCIDRETQPALYLLADRAAEMLRLELPITLYQAQQSGAGLNAAFVWMPDEAHIVLQGPLAERLSEREMTAVFGHELAHAALWTLDDSAYHVAERVLDAMVNDRQADQSHERTQRYFRLYNEVFCDRGALLAAGDLETAVSALVKIETGVTDVNAASFLQQADEVLTADRSATEEWTHPETVVRARCLRLWSQQVAETAERLREMIEGRPSLARLDLLEQVRVTQLTRDLVIHLIEPEWIRSDLILAHARLFFDDGHLPDGGQGAPLPTLDLERSDAELADYVCYILLDFATCDAELQEQLLARTLLLARDLSIEEEFLKLATEELQLRKRQVASLKSQAEKIVADANAAGSKA